MKSLLCLSRSLLNDIQRLQPEVVGLDRDYKTIEARVEDEGIGFLTVALPAFGKAFDRALSDGRLAHTAGFQSGSESLPKFLRGLTSLVFDTKTGTIHASPCIEAIISIRQVLYMYKKFVPSDSRELTLATQATNSFYECEEEIGSLNEEDRSRLNYVSKFILQGLDEFLELDCKHGPGAVYEGYTANQKWQAVDRGILALNPMLLNCGYDLHASLREGFSMIEEDHVDFPTTSCARLVTVPKSSSAMRTITVEPCLNQFVQQGYNLWLRESISRCQVLRSSLTLDSQRPNQELAIEGSRTGDWCTIDLSSASDLLSLEVVEACFSNFPRFLRGLKECRTPSVIRGDTPVTLKKYAGMGNATTFPVQSVAFALIAITAITAELKELSYEKVCNAGSRVHVFGDDIIVASNDFQVVTSWISRLGLKINRGKTFSRGMFRESCGVDAYAGVDTTPVYVRFDPDVTVKSPGPFASSVASCNDFHSRGYWTLANTIRKYVEGSVRIYEHDSKTQRRNRKSALGQRLPLVSRTCAGLGWTTFQDVSEFQRWNKDLHRWEVLTYVGTGTRRPDVLEGMPALLKFYRHPLIGRDDETHLESTVKPHTLRLHRRWVQA